MQEKSNSNTISFGTISPDETKFVLELLSHAKQYGIVEIQYKDLRVRLSLQAQTGSGPVDIKRGPGSHSWNTTIQIPE